MSYSAMRFVFFGALLTVCGGQLHLTPSQDPQRKPLGSALLFTCSLAKGTTGEMWWINSKGNQITETFGRLYVESEDAQTLKLYITEIVKGDAGKYSCWANIGDRNITEDVTLMEFEDITFGDFPRTQHPKINEDALILCVVRGEPTPAISWRHNGRRLKEDSRYSFINASHLIIRNITEDDNGQYICRGEVQADGRYKEEIINIIVHIPPQITQPPESVEIIQDASVSLSCKATGLPQPTFEFFKVGSDVPLLSSDRVSVNSETGSLSFTAVNKSDDGNYTCKAVNRVGSDSASGQLRVLVKPSISQFKDIEGDEGKEYDLTCIADGDPLPSLTFYRMGSPEEYKEGLSEDQRYTVTNGKQGQLLLTLHKLQLDDAGKYSCNATSKIGSDEKTASVTVNFEPSFAITSEPVYNWAGKTKNLTCVPLGEPTPEIVWMYSNQVLENNDTFQIYNLTVQSVLEVTVRDVDQSWIYGPYVCQATNKLGTATKVFDMRRAVSPGEPDDVKVIERLATAIVLEVTPPGKDGGVPVTGYSVSYSIKIPKMADSIDETVGSGANGTESLETIPPPTTTTAPAVMIVESSGRTIRIEGLNANTMYQFKVRSRNDVGLGDPFELTDSTVAFSEPRPVIINSKNMSTNSNEYTVTWEIPNTGGRPVEEYEFRYRQVTFNKNTQTVEEMPDRNWITATARDNNNNLLLFTIKALSSNSYYQVTIRARNEIGWSQPSKEFLFSTVEDPSATSPSTPEEDTATEIALTIAGREEKEREGGDDAAASSQQAGVGTGAVVGIVFAIFIVVLVIVDVACFFVNKCGVTSFLCARLCKNVQSKEKAMEEGESSEIVKQPLPDDATVVSVPEIGVEKFADREEQEKKLNQVPEEQDEDLKKPSQDNSHSKDQKVIESDEVLLTKIPDTTATTETV